jgi:hypothetical protein
MFRFERTAADQKSSYVSKAEVDWFSVNAAKGGPMIPCRPMRCSGFSVRQED